MDTAPEKPYCEWYGYALAVVCVAIATAAFHPMRVYFAKGQWALLYLLIVVFVASLSGFRAALLASLLSFFAWNYFFLPPFNTLRVADPKDWISLLVFLVVGVALGLQTGRLRERETQAIAREHEMAILNEFSAHLVSDSSVADIAGLLMKDISRATGACRCAVFLPDADGLLRQFGPPDAPCPLDPSVPEIAAWVFQQAKAVGLPDIPARTAAAGWPISVDHTQAGGSSGMRDVFIPLQTALRREGVFYAAAREDGADYRVHEARLLVAVANQTAAFLERKHLQVLAVQADALREADRLKSTLVSSVSHELKTPLASITATISNLLEEDVEWDKDAVRSELEAVQEDLNRLNSSIGSLLDLSRLESAAWRASREWYEFGEILGTAISRIPQRLRSRVSFLLPDDLPPIYVDFPQWTRVLQNLLENALSYSPAGSPVRVGADADQSFVRMWVEDEGPGIPPEERERIFEKFFRGTTSASAPSGTGLGLAVTREIVRSHGGRIWVEDVSPHGARFVTALPRQLDAEKEAV